VSPGVSVSCQFSTFFYNQIRPFTGKLFSTVGNFIYHVLLWLNLSSDVK